MSILCEIGGHCYVYCVILLILFLVIASTILINWKRFQSNTFLSARGRKISKILIFLTTELMLFQRGNRDHGNFQRGETWMVTFNINWIYLCSLNCNSHLSEYCEPSRRLLSLNLVFPILLWAFLKTSRLKLSFSYIIMSLLEDY